MPQPTTLTLATGQVTRADALSVELHTPAAEPAFVLVVWPAAASVRTTTPTTATFKILADARTTLSRRRGDRRTR